MNNHQESAQVSFCVNEHTVSVDPNSHSSLLMYLRVELRLTGSKSGCATGHCGACNALVGDNVVQSCQLSLASVSGSEVKTLESIVQTPLGGQIANTLIRYDAAQCGYCLPGIVVAAYAEMLNAEVPNPVNALRRNLCRCGAHSRILKALQTVIDERECADK